METFQTFQYYLAKFPGDALKNVHERYFLTLFFNVKAKLFFFGELRPYWVNILPHWHVATAETYPMVHMKCQFREKNPVFRIQKFPYLVH